ncbi:MAG: transporter substrate-binding domain-containing protein, partial [Undibacterium sp.]|nr:transporter substrate-binding domain-containing protein [Undibacterium sp.]
MRKLIFSFAAWHFFGSALAAEKVVLEMDNDYAPYSFVENGELKGLYVDLLKSIAARLAPTYDVQLQAIPWKRGLY